MFLAAGRHREMRQLDDIDDQDTTKAAGIRGHWYEMKQIRNQNRLLIVGHMGNIELKHCARDVMANIAAGLYTHRSAGRIWQCCQPR